jgi:hypothetical protein
VDGCGIGIIHKLKFKIKDLICLEYAGLFARVFCLSLCETYIEMTLT